MVTSFVRSDFRVSFLTLDRVTPSGLLVVFIVTIKLYT